MNYYKVTKTINNKPQHTPVEVPSKDFDSAARMFFKKVAKFSTIMVDDGEVVKYYRHETKNIFVELDDAGVELRKIIL